MHEVGLAAVLLSAGYFLVSLVVLFGARRHAGPGPAPSLPMVSVVVAARNEEDNLPATLESLAAQDYPADRWELIVIDDRSTDRTAEIVRADSHARLVQISDCPDDMGGKQHALMVGIEQATGDIILMTDADCVVPPGWVSAMTAGFEDPSVGIVSGMVRLPSSRGAWVNLQRADLGHLLATGWGAIGVGTPITAIGNNLALRRTAYDGAGGYGAIRRTIVEDCAIVQSILRSGPWKVVVAHPDAAIVTDPVPTVRGFLRQRARWSTGTFLMRPGQQAFVFTVFVQRVLAVAAAVFAATGDLSWSLPAIAWGFWFVADSLAIYRYAKAFDRWWLVLWTPAVTLWQATYHVISGAWAFLLPGAISWKGVSGSGRRS